MGIKACTGEPALQDHPIGQKNVVVMTGSLWW